MLTQQMRMNTNDLGEKDAVDKGVPVDHITNQITDDQENEIRRAFNKKFPAVFLNELLWIAMNSAHVGIDTPIAGFRTGYIIAKDW